MAIGTLLTQEMVLGTIAYEEYFTGKEGVHGMEAAAGFPLSNPPASLELVTFCVLVLRNGATVVGESYVADSANFDQEKGRQVAKAKAVAKIWELEGYLLKQKLHESKTGFTS